ncbi:hypothetical protein CHS0354_017688 [Potamilus streckersoni]|uniref:Uncharacterized protein n=1 Tax=Potamilus streckersoni TaxID=2493646 RepID=A0AAE0VR46_9BIVA|nr:hypothetical protein CHS0354_017688 [Potamilus streckersoni]
MTTQDDELEEELFCAICADFYDDPLILPCAHSFCRRCLIERINKGETTKKEFVLTFDCPICRSEAELDESGIDSLPRNRLLRRIVDKYKAKILKEQKAPMADDVCTAHGKSLGAFCAGCKDLLCIDCMLGDHRGHNFEQIDDVYKRKKNVLLKRVSELQEELQALNKVEEQEVQYLQEIAESCKNKSGSIEAQFDEFVGLIQQSKHSVLEDLQTREKEERGKVQAVLDNIRASKEDAVSSLASVQQRLSLDKIQFLKVYKDELSLSGCLKLDRKDSIDLSTVRSPRSRCFLDCSLELDNLNLEAAINNAHLKWEPEVNKFSPKHLAEQYNEIYEKEWKSAYLEATSKNKDEVIVHLLDILMNAYQEAEACCEKHLEELTQNILKIDVDVRVDGFSIHDLSDNEFGEIHGATMNTVTEGLRKLRAQHYPTIHADTLEFMVHQESAEFAQSHDKITTYAKKCFQMCFWLCIQDPPLHVKLSKESELDRNCYKHIKRKVRKKEIVVWPPLYLYKDGPLIAKGILFVPP